MSQRSSPPAHTCLAGPCFSSNRELTDLLAPEFLVTLVPDARLVPAPLLASIDILLLDCGLEPAATLALVPELKRRHRHLDIVLVDGGITQQQLAAAIAAGARDYFPADCEPQLLAGRIRGLARLRKRAGAEPVPPAANAAGPP